VFIKSILLHGGDQASPLYLFTPVAFGIILARILKAENAEKLLFPGRREYDTLYLYRTVPFTLTRGATP
jgi:hypothetical protein